MSENLLQLIGHAVETFVTMVIVPTMLGLILFLLVGIKRELEEIRRKAKP